MMEPLAPVESPDPNDLIGFYYASRKAVCPELSFLLRPIRMGCEYCSNNFQVKREIDYPYVTLHIVFSGCSFLSVGGNEYLLKKGDAFLVLAGEKHSYSNEQNTKLGYLWIELDINCSRDLLQWLRLTQIHTLDAACTGALTAHLLRILRYVRQYGDGDVFALSGMCYTLLMLLFSAESSINSQQIPSSVTAALYYISRHFTESLSVKRIAAFANVSESCLSKYFRSYIGTSPAKYILLKKTEHAIFMLKNTSLNCDQIAEKCGFCDAAHLNRVFSHHVGVAPSQIRTKSL